MHHSSRKLFIIFLAFYLLITISVTYSNAQTFTPEKENEQIEFANGLFERGLFDMAASEYKEFISTYGQSSLLSEAHFGLAESCFFASKYKDAIDSFENVITLQGTADKVAVSYLRIAQSHQALQDNENAFKSFSAVNINSLPEKFHQIYYFSLAKSLRETGNKKAAIVNLEKAASLNSDEKNNAAVRFDLAELYSQTNRQAESMEIYQLLYSQSSDHSIKSLSLFKKGELLFRDKKFDEARKIFLALIDEFKDESIAKEALKGALLSLYEMGEYEEVASIFEIKNTEIAFVSENFDVIFAVGNSYLLNGKYEKAALIWDDILAKFSIDLEKRQLVLLKKAETLIRSGNAANVTGFLEQYNSDLQGAGDKIAYLKAEILYAENKFKEAADSYKIFMNDFPQSSLVPDALYGLAYALKKSGEEIASAEYFTVYAEKTSDIQRKEESVYNAIIINAKLDRVAQVIALSESYLKDMPKGTYAREVMYLLGTFSQKNGDHERSAQIFNKYIDSFPEDDRKDEVLFLTAYNIQQTGKLEETISAYERVLEQAKKRDIIFSALKNLGLIALNKDDQNKAAGIFDKLIHEFADKNISSDIYVWLAEKYHKEKRYSDILAVMDSAQKAGEPGTNAGLFYYAGEALRETGKCEDALTNYQKSIEMGSQTIDFIGASRIGKAKCYEIRGMFDEARKEMDEVLTAFPDDDTIMMRARFELGELEALAGRLEEAYKFYMLVAVLYSDPDYSAEALFRAGEIFEKLEKKEEANKTYSEILERYPQSPRAEAARQKLGISNL